MAIVEPGVTYSELQPQLAKEGPRLPMPLFPRTSKSVMASLLEREPTLIPKYQWQLSDPLRCTEVVWGNGEILKTGEAGSYGPLEEQWKRHLVQVSPVGFHLGVAGYDRLPRERIEFQEKDIMDIAQQFGVWLVLAIPEVRNGQVLAALSRPSKPYWKLSYKGGCQDIFFLVMEAGTPEEAGCNLALKLREAKII